MSPNADRGTPFDSCRFKPRQVGPTRYPLSIITCGSIFLFQSGAWSVGRCAGNVTRITRKLLHVSIQSQIGRAVPLRLHLFVLLPFTVSIRCPIGKPMQPVQAHLAPLGNCRFNPVPDRQAGETPYHDYPTLSHMCFNPVPGRLGAAIWRK